MTDFMASIVIIGVVLALFATMWNLGLDSQTSFRQDELMKQQSERTLDLMVSTSGYPEDWEESGEPDIVGFAEQQNVLSVKKINAFSAMDYEEKRSMVKTQDFSLVFRNVSGDILGQEFAEEVVGDLGENPFDQGEDVPSDSRTVVKSTRDVALNVSGDLVSTEVIFLAWR